MQQPSTSRKLLVGCFSLLALTATIELGAVFALRLQSGEWQSLSSLQQQRAYLLAQESTPTEEPEEFLRSQSQRGSIRDVIHPYLGFVVDPAVAPGFLREIDDLATEVGLPGSTNPFERPAPDKLIVFVMGGSVAQGFAHRSQAIARELKKIARFADRNVVVVSAATGGFKQPQQLMALNYLLLLGARPDVVINLDGFNEVALPPVHLLPLGVHPTYPRIWPARLGEFDAALRRIHGRASYLEEQREQNARRFNGPLAYSRAAGLVWQTIDLRLKRSQARVADQLRDLDNADDYQLHGPSIERGQEDEPWQLLVDIWSNASLLMHRLCQSVGIEYYHFLQPNQYVEGSKPLSKEERQRAWREDHPYRVGVIHGYPRLQVAGEQLRDRGVAFFDLTDAFQEIEDMLYFDDCCHFRTKGHRVLAQRVAEAIGSHPREQISGPSSLAPARTLLSEQRSGPRARSSQEAPSKSPGRAGSRF